MWRVDAVGRLGGKRRGEDGRPRGTVREGIAAEKWYGGEAELWIYAQRLREILHTVKPCYKHVLGTKSLYLY